MSIKPRELWIDIDYSTANIFDHDPSKSFQDARLANKILHVIEFAKVQGLIEALEFYANPDDWRAHWFKLHPVSYGPSARELPEEFKGYEKAREALRKFKGEK